MSIVFQKISRTDNDVISWQTAFDAAHPRERMTMLIQRLEAQLQENAATSPVTHLDGTNTALRGRIQGLRDAQVAMHSGIVEDYHSMPVQVGSSCR